MRLEESPLNTIWKYALPVEDDFTLMLPIGSVPLSVGVQREGPVVWVAVDADAKTRGRHRFSLRGTGHPFPGLLAHRFVGTFQLESLGLVFHLFDQGPEEQS